MKVSERIKQIRKSQTSLSKKKISMELGISIPEYEDIENGVTDITLTKLEEIAMILEVPISYLVGGQRSSPAFVNNFYNGPGNKGTINIMNMYQGYAPSRLLQSEQIQDDVEQIEAIDITSFDDESDNKE